MTDMQDAYDHNVAGLEIGQGGVPTTDQLVAIYNKANALGMTISLKAASALPGASYVNTDPYARRTLQASKTAVNGGRELQRGGHRHRDRHDRRRRGVSDAPPRLPGDGRDRPRPLLARRPDLDADGHQHERLSGWQHGRHAQLDGAGRAGGRQWS